MAAAALAAVLYACSPATAESRDVGPASEAWGDRFYGYGEGEELPAIHDTIVEGFEGEQGWSCSMSTDEVLGTVRGFESGSGQVLGLKVEFLRRAASSLLLRPPRPILVDSRCVMLSVRVLGRNLRHALSIIALDYYGGSHELPLGRLDFTGWKTMKAYVPRPDPAGRGGIVQEDRHYSRAPGLRIAGLKLDFDPEESYGSFYAYFDDIEATIEALAAPPENEPAQESAPADAAAPSATPTKETDADPAKASARILSTLSGRIGAALVYPDAARRRGLEGSLVAAFTVDEGGALVAARVEKSSGSELLDAAGIELLKSVFPVENDAGKRLELRIEIGYRLTR